jgi:hypothetical protein
MATWERRGRSFMPEAPLYRIEQEHSLELPLAYAAAQRRPNVAVVLHAFHAELLPEFRVYLENIPFPADLFVTVDTEEKRELAAACLADWRKGSVELRVVPNRGRDVAPKLVGVAEVHDRYEYVLHLHTKSSSHEQRLAGWRGYLLETLLGSPEVVRGVFEAFARAPRLGFLAPQHIDELRPWIRWGANHPQAEQLAARMGFALPRDAPLDFPSGSMFWARCAALRPLLDLRLTFDDFQPEEGQTDGTLAHAIERLYFLVCEQAGFDWLKVTARGELHEQGGVTAVSSPQELDRFLVRHRLRLASSRDEERSIGIHPVITSPPPKPRRVLHATWRAALGEGLQIPDGRRLAVVLHGAPPSSALLHSVEVALGLLPPGARGEVLVMPGASRVVAQQAGFAAGADLVLVIGADGLLHPNCGVALLQMSEAHEGRALIEVAGVPSREAPADADSLRLQRAAGPAIAIPRALHDAVGGHDGRLSDEAADQDCSQRARAHGFEVLLCPRALFLASAGEGPRRMSEAPGVDIVTRLYDLADLPLLDQLLFSITGQADTGPARLHVMLQRFSFDQVQSVRQATRGLRRLSDRVSVMLHNWDNPAPRDLRVPLLNWGLEVAQGRYVACLDVNEQLRPHACGTLLARLRETPAAVALGGVALQPVRWWGDVILAVPDQPGTAAPRPVFMVDRDRLAVEDCVFRTGEPDAEIEEFLERLGTQYAVDRRCESDAVALRTCPL